MSKVPQPLSREEARRIIAAFPNTTCGIRNRALVALLYRGAMRIGAALRLKPTDIDLEKQLVYVQNDKGKKSRVIVVDRPCLGLIEKWMERRKELGATDDQPLFCSTHCDCVGHPMVRSTIQTALYRLRDRLGINKRVYLHLFRHTAASEMFEEDFPITTIQAQLGHSSVATTALYLHQLRPDHYAQKLKERPW